MSLYKANRWASEAKENIDAIMSSYEDMEADQSKKIEELEEEIAQLKVELRAAQEALTDAQSELESIASPEDPSSPFNR
ncbi:MAG: hypothetical protein EBU46_00245 [Nitrosomonadaceae bacterium]|nr:hypothetical protein [Nitrosomonadaceae bacterium]